MKLLLTIDFPPEIGGIQQYLYDRVVHLYSNKDAVISGAGMKALEMSKKLPCKMYFITTFAFINKKLNLIPMFFLLLKLHLHNKEYSIEAGNIYSAIPAFLVSLIIKNCSYSIFFHGMELLQLQNNTIKSAFLKAVIKRASHHFIVSEFTLQLLTRTGTLKKYSYAPPKIDLTQYEKSSIIHDIQPLNILAVGRFVRHKGHAVLIDTVSTLPQSIDWKLTIAGDGPLYNSLLTHCIDLSISTKVSIKRNPSREELIMLYHKADIFVFPSLNLPDAIEGFGIVLLEAMAFNIPIIASHAGGIPEVVTSECAILVPPGNVTALGDAIKELYYKPYYRKQLSEKAFERVRDHFSWK
jgi:phosphatidylinositol alpha-1,6-mannosyltransferase